MTSRKILKQSGSIVIYEEQPAPSRAPGGGGGADPSATVAPLDGSGDAGASDDYSRGDHKHADTDRHDHANKTLLDTYTQTEADLSVAVSNSAAMAGGTTDQALVKNSGTDYDFSWKTIA